MKYFYFIILLFLISCVSEKFMLEEVIIIEDNQSAEKENKEEAIEERSYSSNILENVRYSSNDPDGNEYIIVADQGEIDIKNSQIIFLKNVKATIKLKNSDNIKVSSDFGKYDANTLDTVFTENVLIEYLENKIIAGYLDFSISRNSMIISKNVVFDNDSNILKTDVVEIDLKTRDTKFYMYNKDNKVSLIKNN